MSDLYATLVRFSCQNRAIETREILAACTQFPLPEVAAARLRIRDRIAGTWNILEDRVRAADWFHVERAFEEYRSQLTRLQVVNDIAGVAYGVMASTQAPVMLPEFQSQMTPANGAATVLSLIELYRLGDPTNLDGYPFF